ncbi:MAG: cellulase family glycosylhydrolase [Patescibacteria group bacterium]|jgi:hypothetical protein|nr:cellulase family glycosylhydrolase [Patescibacteria group bacterium]
MLKIFKKLSWFKKISITLIIIFFVFFLLSLSRVYEKHELKYGLTFSQKQAIDLGLDWKELFVAMLDDLGVKNLRLSAYWNEIESINNNFYWDDLDWQIEEASKRDAQIILAVGGRLPRWPECHIPSWAESLSKDKRETETLSYIELTIKRYKDNKNIVAWQIENEPFLSNFGECPDIDPAFLDREIELVRSIDSRQIVVTDSGELSVWVPAAKRADIFGTTMYRKTYSNLLQAYVSYPIEPSFFRVKRNLAKIFARPDKWIVIELQAEPWGPQPFQYLSPEERARTMDYDKFVEMMEFSRQTGFEEFYLWGVEWWYWEKINQNNPQIWNEAKTLF